MAPSWHNPLLHGHNHPLCGTILSFVAQSPPSWRNYLLYGIILSFRAEQVCICLQLRTGLSRSCMSWITLRLSKPCSIYFVLIDTPVVFLMAYPLLHSILSFIAWSSPPWHNYLLCGTILSLMALLSFVAKSSPLWRNPIQSSPLWPKHLLYGINLSFVA